MGELTRKQHRVKRKLEERPQSLTQRDTDALDELLEAGNEKSRVEVLQASCSVAQGHPEVFDEIRDTIADRLTKSELSALERHRAATLYGEVLISLLTDVKHLPRSILQPCSMSTIRRPPYEFVDRC